MTSKKARKELDKLLAMIDEVQFEQAYNWRKLKTLSKKFPNKQLSKAIRVAEETE